jgi:hypothetical protein
MSLLRHQHPTLMSGRRPLSGTTPAFGALGAINSTSGAVICVPGFPANLLINDILILIVGGDNNSLITCPAGWQQLGAQVAVSADYSGAVFWRRADGTETGTVTVTRAAGAGAQYFGGRIGYFRGCVPSGFPFESVVQNSGTGTDMLGGQIVISGPNRRLVHCWTYGGAGTGTTPSGGWSNDFSANSTTGDDGSLAQDRFTGTLVRITPAPTRVITASEPWVATGFALLPP